MNENRVTILVAIADEEVRNRVLGALAAGAIPPPPKPFYHQVGHEVLSLEETPGRLHELYRQSPDAGAILLSDGLVDAIGLGEICASSAAKELFDAFGERFFSTVAISRTAARVADVDRIVPAHCAANDIASALRLCLDRLAYLRIPPRIAAPDEAVDARTIRWTNETEVHNYFTLRYQVYRAMCYLDPSIEENRAGLEIDWFDTHAIHFGAFTTVNGYPELIGTARLITTKESPEDYRHCIRTLASRDPSLQQWMETTTNGALLPVLHNQPALLRRITAEELILGEVSRVIVRQQYRGWGVSRALMRRVIQTAVDSGVTEWFLECLPMHIRLDEAPTAGDPARAGKGPGTSTELTEQAV